MSKDKEVQEIRNLEEYVKNLRKDMDKRLADLKDQLRPVHREATKTLTERPILALGVAFVAGMALGIALSRSGD